MLCFECLVDLLVELLIGPRGLRGIKITAPDDPKPIALTVESGTDILEAA